MGRGVKQAALSGYGNTQAMGETANLRGQGLYNELFPQLSNEATNPQGYGPAGLTAMNTASQQSIGGSQAAAAGAGNALAARTRNAGAAQPVISEANREGSRELSQNALGIQASNERLRQQQQQSALRALQGLYGTEMSTALGAQGIGPSYLGVAANPGKGFWSTLGNNFAAALGGGLAAKGLTGGAGG